ncbi:MAG: hypothetical protein WC780_16595 [Lentimicrobiaceae bacterium]|jgi:hypothetical protein
MRKTILFISLIICIFASGTYAQKKGTLTVNTKFSGILNGYDYITKTLVYVDGDLAGETSELVQSKPNSCSVTLPRGMHTIRIVNLAYYEGKWEEHTLKNNYALDALYEGNVKVKKKFMMNLVFDITAEKTLAKLDK